MRKLAIVIFILTIVAFRISAQEIKVLRIEEAPSDLTARTRPRKDLNGEPCALLKISLPSIADVVFDGAIVGDYDYVAGVYNVYVPKGTRRISFMHNDYRPGTIDFHANGISVLGSRVYNVYLAVESASAGQAAMKLLVLKVEPSDATVEVNGVNLPNIDGYVRFPAEDGKRYSVKVYATGKHTRETTVLLDPNKDITTQTIVLFDQPKPDYEARIVSKHEGEIWIDGIKRSDDGNWIGALTAGQHEVDVYYKERLIGHSTIEITSHPENNVFFITADYGSISVTAAKDGVAVYMDGRAIGRTPLFRDDILPGTYVVSITPDNEEANSLVANVVPFKITYINFGPSSKTINKKSDKNKQSRFIYSVSGGVTESAGEATFYPITSSCCIVSESLGYQFTPVFAARLFLGAGKASDEVYPVAGKQTYHFNFVLADIDCLFDVCNIFRQKERRFMNPYFGVGLGAAYAFNNGEAQAIHSKYPAADVLGKLWDQGLWTPAGRGFLGIDFRASPVVSIVAEVGTNVMSDYFNSKDGGAKPVFDYLNTATIGLKISGARKPSHASHK